MPNSEDYTVVWAGMHCKLDPNEVEQAEAGSHRLIMSARMAGLNYWLDIFARDLDGNPIYSLLIGERLGVLGYKEGLLELALSREGLAATLARTESALQQIERTAKAEIHILLHIEDY